MYIYIYITDINPSRINTGRREKPKLNFYFHTSLRCLKKFYEGLKGKFKNFTVSKLSSDDFVKVDLQI